MGPSARRAGARNDSIFIASNISPSMAGTRINSIDTSASSTSGIDTSTITSSHNTSAIRTSKPTITLATSGTATSY